MYDAVYNELADAGVAVKMEGDGKWLDFLGHEVTKEKAFGRNCTHKLTHPDHFIFVDEVGSNTNMTKDGNKGGEKLACERGTTPHQQVICSDTHFTTLGFTNTLGQLILCLIIINGNKSSADQVLGFDVMKSSPPNLINGMNKDEIFLQNIGKMRCIQEVPPMK